MILEVEASRLLAEDLKTGYNENTDKDENEM